MERKVVTELSGPAAADTYELCRGPVSGAAMASPIGLPAAAAGLRPRPCRAGEYDPGRTLRRIERRNEDLRSAVRPARATQDSIASFSRYLNIATTTARSRQ